MKNHNNYKKSATIDEFTIGVRPDGSIEVLIDGRPFHGNVRGLLRDEIARQMEFGVDPAWNTQQLGSKLIDFINSHKQQTKNGDEITAKQSHSTNTPKRLQTFQIKLEIKGAYDCEWFPVDEEDAEDMEDPEEFFENSGLAEEYDNYENCLFTDDVNLNISVYDADHKLVFQDKNADITCYGAVDLENMDDSESEMLYNECQNLWKEDYRDFPVGYYLIARHEMKWKGFILTVKDEAFDINKLCFIQAYRCNMNDDPVFTPCRMAYNNQLIQCQEDEESDWEECGTEYCLVQKRDDYDDWTLIV